MTNEPGRETNAERKASARAAREAAQAAAGATARRSRRIMQLLGVLGLAAIVVVAAILLSGGGDKTKTTSSSGALAGAAEVTSLFEGVPQKGLVVGKADAPVKLVEFVDLQCPFCREFELQVLPTLVKDYVRTGKASIELRTLQFIGEDSVTAARAAAAAAQENRGWQFADLLFHSQGGENSGWVGRVLARAYRTAGVDAAKAAAFAKTPAADEPLGAANTLASRYAVDETPTILAGKAGGGLAKVQVDPTDLAGFKKAIDGLLAGT